MKIEKRRKSPKDFSKEFPTSTVQHYIEYCNLWNQIKLILALARQKKAHKIPALLTYLEDQIAALPIETPYRQDLLNIIITKCYEYKRYYPEFSCNKAFEHLNQIGETLTEAEKIIIAEQATFISKTICRNTIPTAKTIIENNRKKFVRNHPLRISKSVHILSNILIKNLDTHRFDISIISSPNDTE